MDPWGQAQEVIPDLTCVTEPFLRKTAAGTRYLHSKALMCLDARVTCIGLLALVLYPLAHATSVMTRNPIMYGLPSLLAMLAAWHIRKIIDGP